MAVTPKTPDPTVRDKWIQEMIDNAKLPKALMVGTKAMQAPEWLPRHPAEREGDWNYRRSVARLRNYFKRTVKVMAGKLFAKPFIVTDPIRVIQEITWDVDKEGTDIQAFMKDLMVTALGESGIAFFLVDRDKGVGRTAAEDQNRKTAPYWVKINLEDLISIRSERVAGGEREITHLRYYRLIEKVINEYESEMVQQIRVIERDNWYVLEKRTVRSGRQRKVEWVRIEQGENTLGIVTLVPLYLDRTGYMQAENPLYDLADMNLEHIQLRSEQRRALQVNSFPQLAVINYEGNLEDIEIGPNSIVGVNGSEGKTADIKYIESQGAHLNAGRDEINDLVDQMRAFGAQFDKPGETGSVESASGRVIDSKEASSILQLWALLMKDAIEVGLFLTDKWLGGSGTMDRIGKVDMNMDFSHQLTDDALDIIFKARQLGDLSRKSFLNVLKMNSKLPEDFNVDQNEAELEDEPDLVPTPTRSNQAPAEED